MMWRDAKSFEAAARKTLHDRKRWRLDICSNSGRLLALRQRSASPAALVESPDFPELLWAALCNWNVVRGVRGFTKEKFRQRLAPAIASLDRAALDSVWETNLLTITPERSAVLFSLLSGFKEVKPTRGRWMVPSKALHHLLPDLAVPIDNDSARTIWGRMPTGLLESDFHTAYEFFQGLPADVDHRFLEQLGTDLGQVDPETGQTVRVGFGRLVDLAILGSGQR